MSSACSGTLQRTIKTVAEKCKYWPGLNPSAHGAGRGAEAHVPQVTSGSVMTDHRLTARQREARAAFLPPTAARNGLMTLLIYGY